MGALEILFIIIIILFSLLRLVAIGSHFWRLSSYFQFVCLFQCILLFFVRQGTLDQLQAEINRLQHQLQEARTAQFEFQQLKVRSDPSNDCFLQSLTAQC